MHKAQYVQLHYVEGLLAEIKLLPVSDRAVLQQANVAQVTVTLGTEQKFQKFTN